MCSKGLTKMEARQYPSPARVKWLIRILLILRYNISKASCLQGFYVVSLYRKHWCYNVTRNLRWSRAAAGYNFNHYINIWKISAFWGHSALHHLSPGVRHYQVITSNRTQVIKQIKQSQLSSDVTFFQTKISKVCNLCLYLIFRTWSLYRLVI